MAVAGYFDPATQTIEQQTDTQSPYMLWILLFILFLFIIYGKR